MERILLNIEYDGTAYSGWQRQNNALSIQEVIEDVITKVQGEKTVIEASGRTDAGVHAINQCAHFDSLITIKPEKWKEVINNFLPRDIRIMSSKKVVDDFHARYWVKDKTYKYVIYNSRSEKAIGRNYHSIVTYTLDKGKMERALKTIEGTHDFYAYKSAKSEVDSTVRTVFSATMECEGDFIYIFVKGSGFLHNMVRNIAGTLIDIGRGRLNEDAFVKAIETKDRNCLGDTAKPQGLFLLKVNYFNSFQEKLESQGKKLLTNNTTLDTI